MGSCSSFPQNFDSLFSTLVDFELPQVTGLGTPDFKKLLQQVILNPPIPPVVAGPSNQGREFPELLNTSDAAVPHSRDVKERPRK